MFVDLSCNSDTCTLHITSHKRLKRLYLILLWLHFHDLLFCNSPVIRGFLLNGQIFHRCWRTLPGIVNISLQKTNLLISLLIITSTPIYPRLMTAFFPHLDFTYTWRRNNYTSLSSFLPSECKRRCRWRWRATCLCWFLSLELTCRLLDLFYCSSNFSFHYFVEKSSKAGFTHCSWGVTVYLASRNCAANMDVCLGTRHATTLPLQHVDPA